MCLVSEYFSPNNRMPMVTRRVLQPSIDQAVLDGQEQWLHAARAQPSSAAAMQSDGVSGGRRRFLRQAARRPLLRRAASKTAVERSWTSRESKLLAVNTVASKHADVVIVAAPCRPKQSQARSSSKTHRSMARHGSDPSFRLHSHSLVPRVHSRVTRNLTSPVLSVPHRAKVEKGYKQQLSLESFPHSPPHQPITSSHNTNTIIHNV